MFKAYETFVWCLKDHFYAIYGRLKKKEKKEKKKVQKIQSGIFGLFLLQWLPGFQPLLVLIFQGIQAKKTQKNIKNGSSEGKSQLI